MRHGIAFDTAEGGDAYRALTPEGKDRVTQILKSFRRRVEDIDLILHSPYVRAAETASLVHDFYPKAQIKEGAHLTPSSCASLALGELSNLKACRRALVVGHQPNLSSLAALLLGEESVDIAFKKAAIAGFEWSPQMPATLLYLLPPKFLI